MLEILLSLLVGCGAALVVILRQNEKLKRDKELHDIEVEDAKLEVTQGQIKEEKESLKNKLEELDENQAPSLNDSEVEKYWKEHGGKQ